LTADIFRNSLPKAVGENRGRIRGLEASVPHGHYEIKMFDDETVNTDLPPFHTIMIPSDLNGYRLYDAAAYVTTVDSSDIEFQLVNLTQAAVDMLSTPVTIDTGDFTSYTSAVPRVIDQANAIVSTGDLIDMVFTGTTVSQGLGVVFQFSP
jgi:hypothetical protein